MNGINTSFGTQSLYQNDGTQGSAKSDDKKQDNKNDSNVIKGAGLNLNQTDLIGQKMANAQKEALKKIMDTFFKSLSHDGVVCVGTGLCRNLPGLIPL